MELDQRLSVLEARKANIVSDRSLSECHLSEGIALIEKEIVEAEAALASVENHIDRCLRAYLERQRCGDHDWSLD
jgi:hypothetical protein